jgi:hypothetical protein
MVCTTEQDDGSGWRSSARGDQAWKEATERVASRNAESRKIAKAQREAYEREREDLRRAAEQSRHAQLLNRRNPVARPRIGMRTSRGSGYGGHVAHAD